MSRNERRLKLEEEREMDRENAGLGEVSLNDRDVIRSGQHFVTTLALSSPERKPTHPLTYCVRQPFAPHDPPSMIEGKGKLSVDMFKIHMDGFRENFG